MFRQAAELQYLYQLSHIRSYCIRNYFSLVFYFFLNHFILVNFTSLPQLFHPQPVMHHLLVLLPQFSLARSLFSFMPLFPHHILINNLHVLSSNN